MALGIAEGEGKSDFRLAVRLQRKSLADDDAILERLGASAKGEIDVKYVGKVSRQNTPWYQTRQRPLLIGCSIGHVDITAGTLGAFPVHNATGQRVNLSNNHVLANEDMAHPGDDIIQPGDYDNGTGSADHCGSLLDFIKFTTHGNLVDAAIASIDSAIDFDETKLKGIGHLRGVISNPIRPGDEVMKVGRTTGVTSGIVTAVELDDIVVDFDIGALSFDNQIEIEGAGPNAFSAGGDSGSLIVNSEQLACGLLFAGGDTGGSNGMGYTYANDINNVLRELDLSLEN